MNAHERSRVILQMIATKGMVTVNELCDRLQVSDMTIRRDLSALENANLVRRVHGGAVGARGRSYEPPFLTRSQESLPLKQAIGQFAAALVNEGDSIALDVGTTTLQMARYLIEKEGITVLTGSLPIANALADLPNIRLILSGGMLRPEEHSLVGDIAEYAFSRFHVDKVFIGIGGIDLEAGLTEYNLEDAQVKRSLIHCGQQRILLADTSKFGRRVFASVAPLSAIQQIVTDDGLDQGLQTALRDIGIEVHLVPVPP